MEILNYGDYRDFLKHTVEEKKKSSSKFSYQSFANKLGVTKSYLKLVVEKRRHISLEKAFPICRYFKFNEFESQYFYFMLLKSNVKDPADQEFFNSILRSYAHFKKHNYDLSITGDSPRELFFDWSKMVITSMTLLADYQHDVDWVHEKLGGDMILDKATVASSMDFLVKNNIIQFENGRLIPPSSPLFGHVAPWDIAGNQRFQTGLLRTSQALDLMGKTKLHRPSRYQMYTLSLSHENAKKIADLYDDFEKRLLALAQEEQSRDVVMMASNSCLRVTATDDTKIPGAPLASRTVPMKPSENN